MTGTTLAARARLSPAAIAQAEAGDKPLSQHALLGMCAVLGLSIGRVATVAEDVMRHGPPQ